MTLEERLYEAYQLNRGIRLSAAEVEDLVTELLNHRFIESCKPHCEFGPTTRCLIIRQTYKRTKAGSAFLKQLAKQESTENH